MPKVTEEVKETKIELLRNTEFMREDLNELAQKVNELISVVNSK